MSIIRSKRTSIINKKYSKIIIALVVVLILGVGVTAWAYNYYFTLPPEPDPEKDLVNKEEIEKSEIAKELGEYTILVLGLDKTMGHTNRTDTIILATIDAENRKAKMLSIPRDTRVKVKGHYEKINSAYVYGGVDLTKEALRDFLGIEIDRYLIVNFQSVIDVVDAIDGIEVDVPVRMYKPLEDIDLKPGEQKLDGRGALAYSRFRDTSEGDIGRVKRQHEVIKLVGEKVTSVQGIKKIPSLIDILMKNVETDIPKKEIGALAKLFPDIMENEISSLVLPGESKKVDGLWYYIPDENKISGK
ncbi:LCP family protein [Desulfonispora thiosulfatigenes]|uniref:LCP family protein n=1 Tax=Desulfonispora thiosulfatigenes TaxID=83661 RepID=UPI0013565D6F|nr:LCP family protein [Desulfonispora thiosulfatigenes]